MNLQMQRIILANNFSSVPATTTHSRNATMFCDGVNNGEAITLKAFEWRQPKTVSFPGGVSRELTYDGLQRLQSYIVKDPAKNPIMSATYNIDTVGNILNQQTEHGVYQYNYDELDRLITVDNPKLLDETYTYDPVGNRLTDNNKPGIWSYNKNNQLTGIGTDTSYIYDSNGSITSKSTAGVTTDYVYNSDNRLIEVKQGATTIATYSYDPFGLRISKNVAGVVTYFMYADEGLIAEFDAGGTLIREYGYKPDSLWGTDPTYLKTGGQYYFYQNDHLGTPKKLTAANGAVVWSAEYQAFGGLLVATESTVENPLRFPGQYFDTESGLHYNYFRYYDPSIGRYITSDPIGIEGGLNSYAYVYSNPFKFVDPTGEWGFTATLVGAGLTGLIIYVTVDCIDICAKKRKSQCTDSTPMEIASECANMCIPFLNFLGYNTRTTILMSISKGIGAEAGEDGR